MFMGITIVPKLVNGQPVAVVTVSGTTADSTTTVDTAGAEIAISHVGGQFHVADYRTVD